MAKHRLAQKLSALRRVVPPGYRIYGLELVGITPLLMSSGEMDRRSDTYMAFRQLGRKKSKTFDDEDRLQELEFYVRIYYDEKIGCYVPGKNIKKLIRDGATRWKKGEDVKRSLIVPDYRVPLIYDGPRTPAELWKAGFYYPALVKISGTSRVERVRPCFDEWSLKCEIAFDPEDLSDQDVLSAIGRSEKYGLGDYRPEFGSFEATATFLRVERSDADADGRKPRDGRAERANRVRTARMLAAN